MHTDIKSGSRKHGKSSMYKQSQIVSKVAVYQEWIGRSGFDTCSEGWRCNFAKRMEQT